MTSTPLSAKRIAIIDGYKALLESLQTLAACLRLDAKEGFPAWVQPEDGDDEPAVDGIIATFQLLTLKEGYHPREAYTRFGLMGVSADTLAQVRVVNAHKETLKDAFKSLKQEQRHEIAEDAFTEIQRAPIIREALRKAGLARLHIKQTTRTIQVLEERPLRVGFTVSQKSHMVYRLTRQQAINLAVKAGNDHLANSIAQLPEDEAIAQVRKLPTHVRANITYRDRVRHKKIESQDSGAKTRYRPDQVSASMPLLYPYDPYQAAMEPPVIHNGIEACFKLQNETNTRLPRSAGIIDRSQPLSESLKLYRYRTIKRAEAVV